MISAKQREKAFTDDFIKLLRKHDADIYTMVDDCEHILVVMRGKHKGSKTIREFAKFKIRA